MTEPYHREFISTRELLALVAPRILTKRPELSGPELAIEVTFEAGKGLTIDVIAAIDNGGKS